MLLTSTQPRNHAPTPALAWLAPATRMHTCTALTHGRPSFPSHVPLVQSAVCRRLKFEPCPSHFARRDKPWTHLPCPILERIDTCVVHVCATKSPTDCLPAHIGTFLSPPLYTMSSLPARPQPNTHPGFRSVRLPSVVRGLVRLVGWLHVGGVWPAMEIEPVMGREARGEVFLEDGLDLSAFERAAIVFCQLTGP
ncbi:hypothetical protein IWX92DRAFT_375198 [Phyllosticta citricarpa]